MTKSLTISRFAASCLCADLRAYAAVFLLGVSCLIAPSLVSAGPKAISSVELENLTWIELRDQIRTGRTTAIVPIGGTEQNGPAMTLGKHNIRVSVLARRIADQLGNAIVAPVIAYVPEGSLAPPTGHMKFPGTLTISEDVFEKMLVSIGQSLKLHGFQTVVFLGDHGGYKKNVQRAVAQLNKAWLGTSVHAIVPDAYYETSSEGFNALLRKAGHPDNEIGTHAALADTALQLAVAPETVRFQLLHSNSKEGSPGPAQGVYGGDPRAATSEMGKPGADAIVNNTVEAIRRAAAH